MTIGGRIPAKFGFGLQEKPLGSDLRNALLIQPTLFFPEVVAAIARRQDDAEAALLLAQELKRFPALTLIDLDDNLADFASEIAAKYRLRGSDSVYAAVALRFGTQLISLDREQLERLPKVLSVKKPY